MEDASSWRMRTLREPDITTAGRGVLRPQALVSETPNVRSVTRRAQPSRECVLGTSGVSRLPGLGGERTVVAMGGHSGIVPGRDRCSGIRRSGAAASGGLIVVGATQMRQSVGNGGP